MIYITFAAGFLIGGITGVCIMAAMVAGGGKPQEEEREEYFKEKYEWEEW